MRRCRERAGEREREREGRWGSDRSKPGRGSEEIVRSVTKTYNQQKDYPQLKVMSEETVTSRDEAEMRAADVRCGKVRKTNEAREGLEGEGRSRWLV